METVSPKHTDFKEIPGEDQITYTWTQEDTEIARVTGSKLKSYYPEIEFVIRQDLVPYYPEDNESALDEIGEMSAYKELQTRVEDGYIHGSMTCSHNAHLGVGGFVQSIKNWVKQS